MLYSMILALKKIEDDIIFSYSDIIYDANISKKLSNKKKYLFANSHELEKNLE